MQPLNVDAEARSSATADVEESVTLQEALGRSDPQGHYAQRVFYVAGAATFCGGMCGAVSSFLNVYLPDELGFEDWQTSLLASSLFWGFWAGSFIGGVACDSLGPGRVTLLSLLLIVVFGALPAVLPGLIIPARMVCGLAICTCYLSTNTYVVEWAPVEKRGPWVSALHITIALGGIGSTLLAQLVETYEGGWQMLLLVNAVPTVVLLVVCSGFILRSESPRWILVSGSPSALRDMLMRIGALPTLPQITLQKEEDSEATTPKEEPGVITVGDRCAEMAAMWRLLALGMLLAFCLNFGSKGSEAWLPQFVREMGLDHLKFTSYFFVQVGKIFGDIISITLSPKLGRMRCIQIGFAIAAITTYGFTVSVPADWAAAWLLSLSFLQGAGMDLLWCILYLYLAEVFPTSFRSTGFGVSMGVGRFGGIVSSSVGNLLPSMDVAFTFYAGSFFVGTLVAFIPAPERGQASLVDRTK